MSMQQWITRGDEGDTYQHASISKRYIKAPRFPSQVVSTTSSFHLIYTSTPILSTPSPLTPTSFINSQIPKSKCLATLLPLPLLPPSVTTEASSSPSRLVVLDTSVSFRTALSTSVPRLSARTRPTLCRRLLLPALPSLLKQSQ